MKTIMFAFDYQVNKALKTYELLLNIWSGRIKAVELAEFCKVVKLSLEGSVTNRAVHFLALAELSIFPLGI